MMGRGGGGQGDGSLHATVEDHTMEHERVYLGGSARIDLVVATALAALGMVAIDAGMATEAAIITDVMELWGNMFPALSDANHAAWAKYYRELMSQTESMARAAGQEGNL